MGPVWAADAACLGGRGRRLRLPDEPVAHDHEQMAQQQRGCAKYLKCQNAHVKVSFAAFARPIYGAAATLQWALRAREIWLFLPLSRY